MSGNLNSFKIPRPKGDLMSRRTFFKWLELISGGTRITGDFSGMEVQDGVSIRFSAGPRNHPFKVTRKNETVVIAPGLLYIQGQPGPIVPLVNGGSILTDTPAEILGSGFLCLNFTVGMELITATEFHSTASGPTLFPMKVFTGRLELLSAAATVAFADPADSENLIQDFGPSPTISEGVYKVPLAYVPEEGVVIQFVANNVSVNATERSRVFISDTN